MDEQIPIENIFAFIAVILRITEKEVQEMLHTKGADYLCSLIRLNQAKGRKDDRDYRLNTDGEGLLAKVATGYVDHGGES